MIVFTIPEDPMKRSIGKLLNFSAIEDLDHVKVMIAVKLDDGETFTYYIRLPAERALGYLEKMQHAVNASLRHAPRPSPTPSP